MSGVSGGGLSVGRPVVTGLNPIKADQINAPVALVTHEIEHPLEAAAATRRDLASADTVPPIRLLARSKAVNHLAEPMDVIGVDVVIP